MKDIETLKKELTAVHESLKETGYDYIIGLDRRLKGRMHPDAIVQFCKEYGIEIYTDEEIEESRFWDKIAENDAKVMAVYALGKMHDRELAEELFDFLHDRL